MRKLFCITLSIAALLCFSQDVRSSIPPHPRVQEMIKSGKIPLPYHLAHRAEALQRGINAGPPQYQGRKPYGLRRITSTTFKALAILVRFSDHPSQVGAVFFDSLLFSPTGNTFRNYYNEVSYGMLDVVTVNLPSSLNWIQAPQTYSYYVNGSNGFGSYPRNAQKLAEDAIAAADPYVNFADYDNDGDGYVDALFIIHSGPGAEFTGNLNDIWSHQWSTSIPQFVDGVYASTYSMEPEYWQLPGDMTCGVYAHEAGHAIFGLPDLYDYDYDSQGLGFWSVMAAGSWGGPTHMGDFPSYPDAWSHCAMGFVTPTNITANVIGANLPSVHDSARIFRLWTNGNASSEYFLVENRQKVGYDSYLPGDGACIFHVDESQSGNDNQWYPGYTSYGHYKVALEQADGLWGLERNQSSGDAGDPYPGSTNNRIFNNSSTPDSRDYLGNNTSVAITNISNSGAAMTANFSVHYYPPSISVTPPSFTLTIGSGDTARRSMTISNTGLGELDYRITYSGAASDKALQAQTQSVEPDATYPTAYYQPLPKGVSDTRIGRTVLLGHGGSGSNGYEWKDSDEPGGPHFEWVDIRSIGQQIYMTGDDYNSGPYPIGFAFPFYGNNFSSFRICTNGWVSFTNPSYAISNIPLPSLSAPENLLAVFWDDLVFSGYQAYYHYDGSRLIIQYDGVAKLGQSGTSYSFEILLYPSGEIVYQYLTMSGDVTSATVGIQNAVQDTGLTVVFNASYLHDNLRIEFQRSHGWLTVSPSSGVVPPGENRDVDLLLDAAGMAGGGYNTNISIASNDSAHNPVNIPLNLTIVGQPHISVLPQSLDFGNVFSGYSRLDTVFVKNVGSDSLRVASVSSDNPVFTLTPASFDVMPGGEQQVLVTFSPVDTGQATGGLTISSNDTARSLLQVPLTGHCSYAPSIAVSPDSFAVTVNEGDSTTRTLVISNSGKGDLYWNASVTPSAESSAVQNLTSKLEYSLYKSLTVWEANGMDKSKYDELMSRRHDAGASATPISRTPSALTGSTGMIENFETGTWPWAPWVEVLSGGSTTSGCAHEGLRGISDPDWHYRTDVSIGNAGERLSMWVKPGLGRFYLGFGATALGAWSLVAAPNTGQLLLQQNANYMFQIVDSAYQTWVSGTWYRMEVDFFNGGYVVGNLYASDGITLLNTISTTLPGFAPAGIAIRGFSSFCGDQIESPQGLEWLHVTPDSGIVAVSSAQSVTVRFNAINLSGGNHNANILIASNDPTHSPLYLPVRLHVIGKPHIIATPDSLDFGNVYTGHSRVDTVQIRNDGSDSLLVNEISSSNPSFTYTPSTLIALAHQTQILQVTFTPTDTGQATGLLTITSNDTPRSPFLLPVTGHGIYPPSITVSPDSFAITLNEGDSASQTMNIGNIGLGELTFTLENRTVEGSQIQPTAIILESPPSADRQMWSSRATTATFDAPEKILLHNSEILLPSTPVTFAHNTISHQTTPTAKLSYADVLQMRKRFANPMQPLRAALLRGAGATYGQSTWDSLNANWGVYGTAPILIDYSSVNKQNLTYSDLENSSADVLIISDAYTDYYGWEFTNAEWAAIKQYTDEGHGLIATCGSLDSYDAPNNPVHLAPLVGLDSAVTYLWSVPAQNMNFVLPTHGLLHGISQPYSPNTLYTAVPSSYSWGRALRGGALVAISPDSSTALITYRNRVYISNVPEDLPNQSDYQLLYNAIVWSAAGGTAWLTEHPASGAVLPGGNQPIEIKENATGLDGGNYSADIVVSSNDPDHNQVEVPVHLHVIGKPHIVAVPDSIDFGNVFTGFSRADTVQIQNTGSDSLVVSNISSSNPLFASVPTAFSLPGHHTLNLQVIFSPTDTGQATGELTITSNDTPRSPLHVPVAGHGIYPPSITVSPDSFQVTLNEGDSTTRLMTIGNTGLGDLFWSAVLGGGSSSVAKLYSLPATTRGSINSIDAQKSGTTKLHSASNPAVAHEIPPVASPLVDLSGKRIGMTGFSWYTTIASDLQARGATVSSVTFPVTSGTLANLDILAIDDAISGASSSDISLIRTWLQEGKGLLLQGDDAASMTNLNALLAGTGINEISLGSYYSGEFTNILPHPTTQNVHSIYADAYGAYSTDAVPAQAIVFDDMSRPHVSVSMLGPSRIMAVANEVSEDANLTTGDTRLFVNQVFDWLSGGGSFLALTPSSGFVAPGDSEDVTIAFQTHQLPGGNYRENITISSDDPAHNPVEVHACLRVIGKPHISVIPAALDFGDVFVGYPHTDTVEVQNIGTDTLFVNNIGSSNPHFASTPTSFTTPANHVQLLLITFAPPDSGTATGTLTITSNDTPRSPLQLPLTGHGIYPPSITILPDSIDVTLDQGDSISQTLTVGNIGRGGLNFDIAPSFTSAVALSMKSHDGTGCNVGHFSHPVPKDAVAGGTDLDPTTRKAYGNAPPRILRPTTKLAGGEKILWDLTHGPNYGYVPSEQYAALASLLSGVGYTIDTTSAGVNNVNLWQYAAVVVNEGSAWFTAYTQAEVTALLNFVTNGGGLVVMGDNSYCPNSNINPVAQAFGTTCGGIIMLDVITNLASHPIFDGVSQIYLAAGGNLSVSPPSYSVATDASGHSAIAVASAGLGKVVIIGDINLWDNSFIGVADNQLFAENTFLWLSTRRTGWLSASPDHGTVTPNSSQDIRITIKTLSLSPGDYSAKLNVTSNDPANNIVQVPVKLHVRPMIISYRVATPWNLVSVPLLMADCRKSALFAHAISEAFAYIPDAGYCTEETLRTGAGYWLRFRDTETITMCGGLRASDSVGVAQGWNLLGAISIPIPVSAVTANVPGMITSQFFGYSNGYAVKDTLWPGFGYWVKCNRSGSLLFTTSSPGISKSSACRIHIVPTNELPPPAPGENPGSNPAIPKEFSLGAAYPNPFNPTTTIRYQLPTDSKVTLNVYNVLGQLVDVLIDQNENAGYKQVVWNARDAASGIYFYRLEASPLSHSDSKFTSVQKVVLVK